MQSCPGMKLSRARFYLEVWSTEQSARLKKACSRTTLELDRDLEATRRRITTPTRILRVSAETRRKGYHIRANSTHRRLQRPSSHSQWCGRPAQHVTFLGGV